MAALLYAFRCAARSGLPEDWDVVRASFTPESKFEETFRLRLLVNTQHFTNLNEFSFLAEEVDWTQVPSDILAYIVRYDALLFDTIDYVGATNMKGGGGIVLYIVNSMYKRCERGEEYHRMFATNGVAAPPAPKRQRPHGGDVLTDEDIEKRYRPARALLQLFIGMQANLGVETNEQRQEPENIRRQAIRRIAGDSLEELLEKSFRRGDLETVRVLVEQTDIPVEIEKFIGGGAAPHDAMLELLIQHGCCEHLPAEQRTCLGKGHGRQPGETMLTQLLWRCRQSLREETHAAKVLERIVTHHAAAGALNATVLLKPYVISPWNHVIYQSVMAQHTALDILVSWCAHKNFFEALVLHFLAQGALFINPRRFTSDDEPKAYILNMLGTVMRTPVFEKVIEHVTTHEVPLLQIGGADAKEWFGMEIIHELLEKMCTSPGFPYRRERVFLLMRHMTGFRVILFPKLLLRQTRMRSDDDVEDDEELREEVWGAALRDRDEGWYLANASAAEAKQLKKFASYGRAMGAWCFGLVPQQVPWEVQRLLWFSHRVKRDSPFARLPEQTVRELIRQLSYQQAPGQYNLFMQLASQLNTDGTGGIFNLLHPHPE